MQLAAVSRAHFALKLGTLCGCLLAPAAAWAQTGVLDQTSPFEAAGSSTFFTVDSTRTWQQQISVGIAGQLEGIKLQCSGTAGDFANVTIRSGAAPSTQPALFQGVVTKSMRKE